jgi:hypothetical protein
MIFALSLAQPRCPTPMRYRLLPAAVRAQLKGRAQRRYQGQTKGHLSCNLQYSCGLVGCHLRRKVVEFAVSHETHNPEFCRRPPEVSEFDKWLGGRHRGSAKGREIMICPHSSRTESYSDSKSPYLTPIKSSQQSLELPTALHYRLCDVRLGRFDVLFRPTESSVRTL